jgi:hypothetical protein
VSRWIEGFHCDGYFCIRGCFWLEKPNFHKDLQVINFELRMRSSALFNLRLSTWTYLFFFSQINADLFLADSRWFIFCAHLRFQSANICVNCFSKFSHPRPNIPQNYSLLKIRGVPPKAGRGYCLSGKSKPMNWKLQPWWIFLYSRVFLAWKAEFS